MEADSRRGQGTKVPSNWKLCGSEGFGVEEVS